MESGTEGTAVLTISIAPLPLLVELDNETAFVLVGDSGEEIARASSERGIGAHTYSLANAPAQIGINPTNGAIDVRTAFSAAARHTIDVIAEDEVDVRATITLVLNVVEIGLVFMPSESVQVIYGAENSGILATAAVMGDTANAANHRFAFVGTEPAGIEINETNGVVRYTQTFTANSADFTLTIRVSGITGIGTQTEELAVEITAPDAVVLDLPSPPVVLFSSTVDAALLTATATGGYAGGTYSYSLGKHAAGRDRNRRHKRRG